MVLSPPALAYGGIAKLRRAAYARGVCRATRLPAAIVSVGSTSLGGSGKTPVAREIAERLIRLGLKVAVVCRNVGGTVGCPEVIYSGAHQWAKAVARHGDEPVLMASWLPGALVVAGRNKTDAAALAVGLGAEVVVVDDGLQHVALQRDLEVVVDSGPVPSLPLPAGYAREFGTVAECADVRWVHCRSGGEHLPVRLDGASPDVRSRFVPSHLVTVAGQSLGDARSLRGRRVLVAAGVARATDFVSLTRMLGAEIVGTLLVGDHRPIPRRVLSLASRRGAELILCTEKDAVRMRPSAWAHGLVALRVRLRVDAGAAVLDRALRALADRWTTAPLKPQLAGWRPGPSARHVGAGE